jgi:hypothetical protein
MFQQTRFPAWICLVVVCLFLCSALPVFSQSQIPMDSPVVGPFVHHSVHNDVSPAVRDLPVLNRPASAIHKEAEPVRHIPLPAGLKAANEPDSVHQQTAPLAPARLAPAVGLGFEGLGNGALGFTPNAAPPDTNGQAPLLPDPLPVIRFGQVLAAAARPTTMATRLSLMTRQRIAGSSASFP